MRDVEGIVQDQAQYGQLWRPCVLDHRLKLAQQLVMGEVVLLTRAGICSREIRCFTSTVGHLASFRRPIPWPEGICRGKVADIRMRKEEEEKRRRSDVM